MSLRPSVPCLGVVGFEKAAVFRAFPPGAAGFEIHEGAPATRSGRVLTVPPTGDVPETVALSGKPVRTTIKDWKDQ